MPIPLFQLWPRGPMARRLTTISQLESRDCRFDPCRGHITTFFFAALLFSSFCLSRVDKVDAYIHGPWIMMMDVLHLFWVTTDAGPDTGGRE
jgi:hypothetical protein